MPSIEICGICGKNPKIEHLFIKEGMGICDECRKKIKPEEKLISLIFNANFGIVDIIIFLGSKPLSALRKLKLEEKVEEKLEEFLRIYYAYHLEIDTIKSEEILF